MIIMETLIDQINRIEFLALSDEFLDALKTSYELGSTNLGEGEKKLLKQDLDFFYHGKGRYLVHKTFAGGIIFLREPETINKIELLFNSERNEAVASVIYSSEKRNVRNTKYKPNAGQIESLTWRMPAIFPNFNKHQEYIKILLIAILGNITKCTCEKYRRDSWFMQFEKPFDIELFLDGKLELKYRVKLLSDISGETGVENVS